MSSGQKRIGDYTLISKVGKGGQASVWKALSPDGTEVAIKKMPISGGIENSKSYEREVAIRNLVQHEYLIKCLSSFQDNNHYYFVYELCPTDMLQFLESQPSKRFPESSVRRWAYQLTQVMTKLNSLNIIHRDLKPENIMLKEQSLNSDIRLTDFGLAKQGLSTLSFVGTLEYASPEIKNCQNYSWNTDVWSLGVIVFASLFGKLPILEGNRVLYPHGINVSDQAKSFIENCMILDYKVRVNFKDLLNHEFISDLKTQEIPFQESPHQDVFSRISARLDESLEPELVNRPPKVRNSQETQDYVMKLFSLSDGLISLLNQNADMEFLKYYAAKYFSEKFSNILNELMINEAFLGLQPEFFDEYFTQSESVCMICTQLELKYGNNNIDDMIAYYLQCNELINSRRDNLPEPFLKVLMKVSGRFKKSLGNIDF
ncbi:hypothetical protein SteCoe_10348 [Stentor coeruleus]|uniref:Protein kinase domain-containing protein n=1 Tax=Stentor coeruleus TaxID=5963 RepID=A0A1R2CFQ8_9CILI|nr:hypothetical protein SteCoe_10348 [Stentor coeruleus]